MSEKTIGKLCSLCNVGIEESTFANVLISRLKLYNGTYQKLNVQMLFDEAGYCPYCFDGQKNYDEDGIDCSNTGKNCPLCIVEKPSLLRNNYPLVLISLVALNLVCFLVIIWYLVLLRRNGKREDIEITEIKLCTV